MRYKSLITGKFVSEYWAIRHRKLSIPVPNETSTMSDLERTLEFQLKAVGISGYEREFRFDPDRKWRSDFAWPLPTGLLVEVDGGTWSREPGRHTRGKGFEEDARKHNKAALLGYVTLRFTSSQVKSGEAVDTIETYLRYFGSEAVKEEA